jgi:hypothetical protein
VVARGPAGTGHPDDTADQTRRTVMGIRARHRIRALGIALVTISATAACGDEIPDVDDSGALGPDAVVDDSIKVLQVQLEYPWTGSTTRART